METLEMSIDLEQLQLKNLLPLPLTESLERTEVTHSPRGNRLRKPFVLWLPKPISPGEQSLREYVINALSWKMHSLIPFTLYNKTVLEVAKHLNRHCTRSPATLYQYVYGIYRFCNWLQHSPDQIIEHCKPDGTPSTKAITEYLTLIDDFIGELQPQGLAPGTISNHVKGVKALFRANDIILQLPYQLPRRIKFKDRSPTPEELQKLMDIADLRERVIISTLALGGFRIGTLEKLLYRHVQRDLEKGITPVHIHVEAEITKGKYDDYDTVLGQEAN
jgi:integrase